MSAAPAAPFADHDLFRAPRQARPHDVGQRGSPTPRCAGRTSSCALRPGHPTKEGWSPMTLREGEQHSRRQKSTRDEPPVERRRNQKKNKHQRRRSSLDAPLAIANSNQVLTFFEWCRLNRFSERTGRRFSRAARGPRSRNCRHTGSASPSATTPPGKRRRRGRECAAQKRRGPRPIDRFADPERFSLLAS